MPPPGNLSTSECTRELSTNSRNTAASSRSSRSRDNSVGCCPSTHVTWMRLPSLVHSPRSTLCQGRCRSFARVPAMLNRVLVSTTHPPPCIRLAASTLPETCPATSGARLFPRRETLMHRPYPCGDAPARVASHHPCCRVGLGSAPQ